MATGPQYYVQTLPAQHDEASYQGASITNDMEHTIMTEQNKQAQHQYYESDGHSVSSGPTKYVAGEHYQPIPASSPQLLALRKKDLLYKQFIRILRFISRILTLFLALSNTGTQSVVLHKYLATRNIIIDGRNAWAAETTVWTTKLLLSVSVITAVVSSVTVALYFCGGGVKEANGVNNTAGLGMFILGGSAHALVWVVTAAAYRGGKTGHDLWGWTCDGKAQHIQPKFAKVINFNRFCGIQSASWYVSIAQAILAIVTLIAFILAWKRAQIKKMTDPNVKLEPVRI